LSAYQTQVAVVNRGTDGCCLC